MASRTDELLELIRDAQGGDESAYDRLFRRYQDRVRLAIRLRMGPRLRGVLDSGDVLQETLLTAVRFVQLLEDRLHGHKLH